MDIEFDPVKDASNQAKHGVSLALAAELDWDAALVWVDARYEYDELRMIALAPESMSCTTWHLSIVRKFAELSVYAALTVVR